MELGNWNHSRGIVPVSEAASRLKRFKTRPTSRETISVKLKTQTRKVEESDFQLWQNLVKCLENRRIIPYQSFPFRIDIIIVPYH